MVLVPTAVTEINANVTAGFQQPMHGQQQTMHAMPALLVRIQGTGASVARIGNAVSSIPGTEFVMPAPTAAAVTGYGGSGGTMQPQLEQAQQTLELPTMLQWWLRRRHWLNLGWLERRTRWPPPRPRVVRKNPWAHRWPRSTATAWAMANCQLARRLRLRRGSNG